MPPTNPNCYPYRNENEIRCTSNQSNCMHALTIFISFVLFTTDDRLFVFCSPMELDFAMQKYDGFNLIKKRKNRDQEPPTSSVDAKDYNKEKDFECFLKVSTRPLEVFTGRYGSCDPDVLWIIF